MNDICWILFFAFDGMGLGHIRRLTRLCRRIIDSDLTGVLRPLFITNSVNHDWLKKAGWPYYFFPSEMEDRFTFNLKEDSLGADEMRKFPPPGLGEVLLEEAIAFLNPSSVIVDSYFYPRLPSICKSIGVPFFAIYDSDWCQTLNKTIIEDVLKFNGKVIIANNEDIRGIHSDDFFYASPFILERNADLEAKIAEKYWNHSGALRILCAQGGGGFTKGNSEFEKKNSMSFIQAIDELIGRVLEQGQKVQALFFTGPYYKSTEYRWRPRHLELHCFETDLSYLFASADFALMRGGYNQVCEAVSMSCPSVIYPRLEAMDDQRQNMSVASNLPGIFCWDGPIANSFDIIQKLIDSQKFISLRQSMTGRVHNDGLQNAANYILREVLHA